MIPAASKMSLFFIMPISRTRRIPDGQSLVKVRQAVMRPGNGHQRFKRTQLCLLAFSAFKPATHDSFVCLVPDAARTFIRALLIGTQQGGLCYSFFRKIGPLRVDVPAGFTRTGGKATCFTRVGGYNIGCLLRVEWTGPERSGCRFCSRATQAESKERQSDLWMKRRNKSCAKYRRSMRC